MTGATNARVEYYLDWIREAENAAAQATDAERVAAWKQVAAGYQFLLERLSGNSPTRQTREHERQRCGDLNPLSSLQYKHHAL